MSFNLLDQLKNHFTSDLITKAASSLGEKESSVSKALSGIFPTVAAAFLSKASTSSSGTDELLHAALDSHKAGWLDNISGFIGNSDLLAKGAELVKKLLGNKADGIVNSIASFAGIKSSSASSLLSLVTPIATSLLGKQASQSSLSANGLLHLLNNQKTSILSALPSGIGSLAGLLGFDKFQNSTPSAIDHNQRSKNKGTKKLNVLPIILFLLVLALLAWFLFNGKSGCSSDKAITRDSITIHNDIPASIHIPAGKLDSLTQNFIYDAGKMITLDLPGNGGKLEVGERSTEAKLFAFLNDNDSKVDTISGNWFELTNVLFKTGGAEITNESMEQLKNIITITKAYPSVQLKVGGYTDNTGSPDVNLSVSQKRAETVAATLLKLGAAKSSITGAEGYGEQWPIADNGTPEGRALNRRVAVNIKAK